MTTPYVDPQTIHNPSPGASPPASWGDTVRDDLEFLIRPPGCQAHTSGTQAVANTTWTTMAFDGADSRDTDGYHSTTTNNSRLTVPTGLGGLYALSGTVQWGANSSGTRLTRYRVNGSGDNRMSTVNAIGSALATRQEFYAEVQLNAGDYVELDAWQSSGSSVDASATMRLRFVALS